MIEGKLWRFESVRPEYWNNTASIGSAGGAGYTSPSFFRFVDVATGTYQYTERCISIGAGSKTEPETWRLLKTPAEGGEAGKGGAGVLRAACISRAARTRARSIAHCTDPRLPFVLAMRGGGREGAPAT